MFMLIKNEFIYYLLWNEKEASAKLENCKVYAFFNIFEANNKPMKTALRTRVFPCQVGLAAHTPSWGQGTKPSLAIYGTHGLSS